MLSIPENKRPTGIKPVPPVGSNKRSTPEEEARRRALKKRVAPYRQKPNSQPQ